MIFVETTAFTRRISSLLTDEDYGRLQLTLVEHPEVGAIIKGSGGIRKIRWAASGRGKRGGARIIYYWAVRRDIILMLGAYSKNEKQDLTEAEVNVLQRAVKDAFQ